VSPGGDNYTDKWLAEARNGRHHKLETTSRCDAAAGMYSEVAATSQDGN